MLSRKKMAATIASTAFLLSFALVGAASALTTSCVGIASASSITWTASAAGGVAPIAFLWGNGSTSSAQTIATTPGAYTMTLQATDASSTIATTTCAATVAQPVPTVSSLTATPSTVTAGQSSLLSWTVTNASSTSIDNSIGAVTGTSMTVTPLVTTTYTLSAVNPSGTSTKNVTITVNATSSNGTGTGNTLQAQIQALLNQIALLKAQIVQLLQTRVGGGTGGTATSTPSTPITCIKFNRDLAFGDDGDDVRELQRELSKDPSILPPNLVTGFFGLKTREALKKFQMRSDLGTSTGFFGPKTRGLLNGHCGNEHSVQMSTQKWMTSNSSHEDEEKNGKGNGRGNSHDD